MTLVDDAMRKCQALETDLEKTLALLGEALRALEAIKHETTAELDRIERHGGTSGFARRVYALASEKEKGRNRRFGTLQEARAMQREHTLALLDELSTAIIHYVCIDQQIDHETHPL